MKRALVFIALLLLFSYPTFALSQTSPPYILNLYNATIEGGNGTVTSITAGTGLLGGTINSVGTLSVDNSYLQRYNETAAVTALNSLLTALYGNVTNLQTSNASLWIYVNSIGNWTADKPNYATLAYVNSQIGGLNNISLQTVKDYISYNGNYSAHQSGIYSNITALQTSNTSLFANLATTNTTANNALAGVASLNLTKLDTSDQRYNDTALILSQISGLNNLSLAQIAANIGNWSADKSAYNTTAQLQNIFAPLGTGGNVSWNETYANTLYYPLVANPNGYYNSTTLPATDFSGIYANVTALQTSNTSLFANVASTNTTANNALAGVASLNITKLDISDQRYNETAYIQSQVGGLNNLSLSQISANIGNWSADKSGIYFNISALDNRTDVRLNSINATSSGGLIIRSFSGQTVADFGPGSSQAVMFYDGITTVGLINGKNISLIDDRITSVNNTKLDLSDQRYNETAYIQSQINGLNNLSIQTVKDYISYNGNYSAHQQNIYNNITALQTSNTSIFANVASTNTTANNALAGVASLNDTKLNVSDQRYNDTAYFYGGTGILVSAGNISANQTYFDDRYLNSLFELFFWNTSSPVNSSFTVMNSSNSPTTMTVSFTLTLAENELARRIFSERQITFLARGTYRQHTTVNYTAGTKSVRLHSELYKYNHLNGSLTQIGTAVPSDVLVGGIYQDVEWTGSMTNDTYFDSNEYLVMILNATVTGGGANPQITLITGGATAAHLEIGLSPSQLMLSETDPYWNTDKTAYYSNITALQTSNTSLNNNITNLNNMINTANTTINSVIINLGNTNTTANNALAGVNSLNSTKANLIGNNIFVGNNSFIGELIIYNSTQTDYNTTFVLKDGTGTPKVVFNASGDSFVNTGNIGIGDATPDALLDVAGNIQADGTLLFDAGVIGMRDSGSNVVGWDGGTSHPSGYKFSTSGATNGAMYILSGGNVGIGTTNPNQALQVVGSVNATYYHGDGSNLTGLATLAQVNGLALNISALQTSNTSIWTMLNGAYNNISALQTSNGSLWTLASGSYTNITALQSSNTSIWTMLNGAYANVTALQSSNTSINNNVTNLNNMINTLNSTVVANVSNLNNMVNKLNTSKLNLAGGTMTGQLIISSTSESSAFDLYETDLGSTAIRMTPAVSSAQFQIFNGGNNAIMFNSAGTSYVNTASGFSVGSESSVSGYKFYLNGHGYIGGNITGTGNITIADTMRANYYYGDGSNMTGIATATNISNLNNMINTLNTTVVANVSNLNQMKNNLNTSKANLASPTFTGTVTVPQLSITTNITVPSVTNNLITVIGNSTAPLLAYNTTCTVIYTNGSSLKIAAPGTIC